MRQIKKTILTLLIGLIFWQAEAQKADIHLVEEYITDGENLLLRGQSISALRAFLSAKRELENSGFDSLQMVVYLHLGKVFKSEKLYEKALENFLKADSLFTKPTPAHRLNKLLLAETYQAMGKNQEAISLYQQLKDEPGLSIAEQASLLQAITNCYHAAKDYRQALQTELQLLDLIRNNNNLETLATVFNNVGYSYKYLGDMRQAFNYFDSASFIFKALNQLNQMDGVPVLVNRAILMQNSGDLKNALLQLQKVRKTVEENGSGQDKARMYHLFSQLYFELGDYYNASVYNQLAIQVAEENQLSDITMSSYELSSAILQEQENYEEALEAYKVYLDIRDSLLIDEKVRQQQLLQQQFLLEQSEKEIQLILADEEVEELEAERQRLELEKQAKELQALRQEKKLRAAQIKEQELLREKEKARLLLEKRQLEAVKSQNEIELLRKNEELQKEALARKELEDKQKQQQIKILEDKNEILAKEKQLQQLQEKEARARVLYIGVGLILILLLISFYLIMARKKNKQLEAQKQQLHDKNEEIQQQNEELTQSQEEVASQRDKLAEANEELNLAYLQITDSVRYAQRIQNAILHPPAEITAHFQDAFIFFQPRDIVSGDFYWFSEVEGKKVIAAVDCTGHGVPGAFMSLIGNDLLHDIVNVRKITAPDQILSILNDNVRNTLKQKETNNSDGMDMALCVYDPKEKTLCFSGAKNPLIAIQNGELQQIKGDRMPIGGTWEVFESESFCCHNFEVKPGDCFYIFSDGYQDQFGGPKNKKFMIKKLRELLLEVHAKPMHQQEQIISKTINEWMGKESQVDDMLVIGFRI